MAKKSEKTLRGIKVAHNKNTAEMKAVVMPVPDKVKISLSQHIGPPCKPLVAKGDEVKVGQKIADSDAFLSATLHSSVSGVVEGFEEIITPAGAAHQVIIIAADGKQTISEEVKPPVVENREDFLKAVRESGLVGLGGAGFPTHIKFNPKNLDEVDTFLINASECEPYITSDYRNMIDHSDMIMEGIAAIKKYLGIKKFRMAIEDNKPLAIEKFDQLTKDIPDFEVIEMPGRYPQGAEKVLIYETCGRVLKGGQLPADVGVLVSNVTSMAFLGNYLKTGMPLVSKCVTVDGSAVKEPKNVIVPIGTSFKDIIEFCGGYKEEPKKVMMGGPMMGIALFTDEYPLLKNNNAVIAMGAEEAKIYAETPCIRCGRCVRACPYSLMPLSIERAFKAEDADMLRKLNVNLCMECGCCAYVCPAKRHLVLTNKMAKQFLKSK